MKPLVMGALVIILLMIAVQFLPDVVDSFDDTITDSTSLSANVTTGASETSGHVVLALALYNDAIGRVTSITSNVGGDVPQAGSYVTGNKTLTVNGLATGQTRTLTLAHDYDATGDFTGMRGIGKMGPTLLLLALVVGIPLALIIRSLGGR